MSRFGQWISQIDACPPLPAGAHKLFDLSLSYSTVATQADAGRTADRKAAVSSGDTLSFLGARLRRSNPAKGRRPRPRRSGPKKSSARMNGLGASVAMRSLRMIVAALTGRTSTSFDAVVARALDLTAHRRTADQKDRQHAIENALGAARGQGKRHAFDGARGFVAEDGIHRLVAQKPDRRIAVGDRVHFVEADDAECGAQNRDRVRLAAHDQHLQFLEIRPFHNRTVTRVHHGAGAVKPQVKTCARERIGNSDLGGFCSIRYSPFAIRYPPCPICIRSSSSPPARSWSSPMRWSSAKE